MVGTEYQAEVPSSLCHYKEGEQGDCSLFGFQCTTRIRYVL